MLAFGDLPERSDLGHLIPAARKTAALPAAERLERLRGDRWIGYTRAQQALAKLEELYTHPQRERMPNLLIVGPTNNGKSMIVVKFKRSKMVTPADPSRSALGFSCVNPALKPTSAAAETVFCSVTPSSEIDTGAALPARFAVSYYDLIIYVSELDKDDEF